MKFPFIILLLFILCVEGNTQTIRFNKTYTDSLRTPRNIVITDSGYVVLRGGGDPVFIAIVLTDTLGNFKWIKKIRDSNNNLYHGAENSLIKINEEEYLLAGAMDKINSDENAGLLVKFNSSFDTIWTRKLLYDTVQIIPYNCLVDSNRYLIIGTKAIGNNDACVLLIKTDTSGNVLWNKIYGGWSYDNGYKIVKTHTGGYLLGGYTRSFTGVPQIDAGDWYLIKTDSAGNQLWQNHYGNPLYDDGRTWDLIATKDSGFIATGQIVTQNIDGNDFRRGRIIRFDKNMNIVWDKQYLFDGVTSGCGSVIELDDGSLVIIGGVFYETETNYFLEGKMFKIKSNGDLLWERAYKAWPTSTNNMSLTQAFTQTPDNGFAITGYCTNSYAPPPTQRMWLVKTDCKGYEHAPVAIFSYMQNQKTITCFNTSQNVDSCFWDFGDGSPLQFTTSADTVLHTYSDTGTFTVQMVVYNGCTELDNDTVSQTVYIAGNNAEYQEWLNRTIQVYPNPAKESVTISMLEYEPAEISIYNMQGVSMYSQQAGEKKTVLNISSFEKGVYTVKVQTGKGLAVRKLVKE